MVEWNSLSNNDKSRLASKLFEKYGTYTAAARSINVDKTTIIKWCKREVLDEIGLDTKILTSEDSSITPRELCDKHGISTEDYHVVPKRVSQWGQDDSTNHYLRVDLEPKLHKIIEPALNREDGWRPPKTPRRRSKKKKRTIVVLSDPHAPLHEERLVDASVSIIEDLKPDEIVCLGDASDNNPWGRHRKNPRKDLEHSAQEAVDTTYELLARWSMASPGSKRTILAGNHDWWLYHRILETLPQLATLKIAQSDERVLDLSRILRLDELGWELAHTGGGDYHDSTYELASGLLLMHGVKTGKRGGAVVEIGGWDATSIIQGHDHKQTLARHVKRRSDNSEVGLWSWSVGAMSRRDLGYSHTRDVHQGFGVITLWDDDRWHPEVVCYDPQYDDVTFRNERY